MSITTTMKSAQTVLYGPTTSTNSYQSVGSVSAGETVVAIVATNDQNWAQIEYDVTGTAYKKRGYVLVSTTNLTSVSSLPHTSDNGTITVKTGYTTYTGPSSTGYYSAGSVSTGESVTDLAYEENGYRLIEYAVTGTSYKKRAYVLKTALNITTDEEEDDDVTYTVGVRPSNMNINGSCYYSKNWYYTSNSSLLGQCTWFCWGRALEKCGRSIIFGGDNNAKNWYANATGGYSYKASSATTPMANAIACFGGTTYGHVVFIETVKNGYVYYTDANSTGDGALSSDDGTVKCATITAFKTLGNKTLNGYLVL